MLRSSGSRCRIIASLLYNRKLDISRRSFRSGSCRLMECPHGSNAQQMSSAESAPLFITESQIEQLLQWEPLTELMEQALYCVTNKDNRSLASSDQPPRSLTHVNERDAILFSMPAYVRDLDIDGKKYNSLACKLVTAFPGNAELAKRPDGHRLPTILGNVLLFRDDTGELECVMGARTITGRRTACATAVATRAVTKNKKPATKFEILAIMGAGVQGTAHAVALQKRYGFKQIRIWNRTDTSKHVLPNLLRMIDSSDVTVTFHLDNAEAVRDADVVVTATFATEPIVQLEWLKPNVHINAIGAGHNHHSELSESIYRVARVYVDTVAGARIELAGLAQYECPVLGEVGQILLGQLEPVEEGITIYHSMGFAALDAAAARLVLHTYEKCCGCLDLC